LAKRNVDALILKAGPTESGIPPTTSPPPGPVGGEVIPIDKISLFLSQYWFLIAILLLPVAYVLYKKRSMIPQWLMRATHFFRTL
jgi:hypothetical protein